MIITATSIYVSLTSLLLQVRRRSKACRAGLKEYDELVAIGHHICAELSHAEAMSLIDAQSATLNLRVKRSEHGLTVHHTLFDLVTYRTNRCMFCIFTTCRLCVSRAPAGVHSSSYSGHSASPRSSTKVLSPSTTPLPSHRTSILSPTGIPSGITSPPDSEAYYGETDSDADTQSRTHRRQRRTPPHARSPARYDNQEEEETSEMSG